MDVGFTSAILASVVCLTTAIAILMRRPRRTLYSHFASLCISLFLWHAASLFSRLGYGTAANRGVGVWQTGAAVLIPPPAISFFRKLLRDKGLAGRRLSHVAAVLSGGLFVLNILRWGQSSGVRLLATLYVFVTLTLVQRALFRSMRRARTEHDRKRLAALFWGGMIAFFCTGGEVIPRVAGLAALGHMATTCYIYFLYQSIIARRLIDLVELLGKAAVLAALTLMLASVYALLVLWVGRDQSGLWLFNTLVASFVILILYDQVRPRIEATTARLLFRRRDELGGVVRHLLYVLRTTIGIDDMQAHVLQALHTSGRTIQVAMYLAREHDSSFYLVGFRGIQPPDALSAANQPSLLRHLRRYRRPILLEHLMHRYQELPTLSTRSDAVLQRELERTDEAIATLKRLRAHTVVPMSVDHRIVGVLTLGTDPISDAYDTDELASLISLAEACAVVIENSHEYEKRRERDRLVAVGEMAAGMAHEIRNPLGAIKGAAQCLDPAHLPPDAQQLVGVIVEETNRLNKVVSQFLEYSRPLRGSPLPMGLNDVAHKTLRLMQREAIPAGITVVEKFEQGLPDVCADPEHIRQVIINLLLNAVQAVQHRSDGGHIIVSTQSVELAAAPGLLKDRHGHVHGRLAILRVTDDGEGIAEADLERIFVPFFTTKPQGTGLGLAICQRIVEAAGGRLEATSVAGLGATFTLRLPTIVSPTQASRQ